MSSSSMASGLYRGYVGSDRVQKGCIGVENRFI